MYLVSLYLFPPFQELEEMALLQCVSVYMSNFVYTTFTIISSIPIYIYIYIYIVISVVMTTNITLAFDTLLSSVN